MKTKSTTLKVRLKDGNYMSMTANIVPSISGVIQRHPISLEHKEKLLALTQNLTLADTIPTETESNSLELLVGNDYYLDIIESEKIVVDTGLYLISSKFGWILSWRTYSGNTEEYSNDINNVGSSDCSYDGKQCRSSSDGSYDEKTV